MLNWSPLSDSISKLVTNFLILPAESSNCKQSVHSYSKSNHSHIINSLDPKTAANQQQFQHCEVDNKSTYVRLGRKIKQVPLWKEHTAHESLPASGNSMQAMAFPEVLK